MTLRERSHSKGGERLNLLQFMLSACIHMGDCICSGGVALELLLLDVLSLCLFWRFYLFSDFLSFASGVEPVASA
jgi:hypothetical protein